ncbi:MAG: DUF5597 domain-containing protein [Prevotella sp.]|nr:DUF5597 domain-containing protein [Prevotella sp.]
MKKTILLTLLFMGALSLYAQSRLQRQGTTMQLTVAGRPMLILGGELSNSAATCVTDIDSVMPRMARLGLNTVLVPAQWDLTEPEEGHFDFTLIDRTIQKARENGFKVIFLWFGAWKNSMSCYAPLWFKKDTKRFPRAMTRQGKPLEIASAFSENVFQADHRAFKALMEHIAHIDANDHTVIMMQIENEIGMLEDARDHSPEADRQFKGQVPEELISFLKKHQKDLHPSMRDKFSGKSGTWTEVFGDDIYTDEIFMAYHYAKYVERLAKTAREVYDMPLYVNAAMNSRGRQPGEYPSAGPLAHLKDIWHCAAPDVDILAPDIYDTGFKGWVTQYALPDNPLFIPETRCCANSGVRALYAFGEHHAIGFSPFAIDQAPDRDTQPVTAAYDLLRQLAPVISRHQGKDSMRGVLFDQDDKESVIIDGDLTLTCRHNFTLPWDSRATDGSTWPEGGAIIIRQAPDDYLIAGSGVVVVFQKTTEKAQTEQKSLGEDGFADAGGDMSKTQQSQRFTGKRVGIGYVDEVAIDAQGQLQYLRRENGDQDHQGRHARISVGDYKILHVKLYEY